MRLLSVVSAGAFLLSASVSAPAFAAGGRGDSPQDKRVDVEVVSTDPGARTLTIRSDAGASTLAVDPGALDSLEGLQPGDRISISVQDPVSGAGRAITATVDGAAASRSDAPTVRSIRTVTWLEPGEAVEFRSWDPASRIVTVDQLGQQRMFLIEPGADVDFDALVPGQSVLLSWRFAKSGNPEAVIRTIPARASARTLGGASVALKTSNVRMRGPVEVLSASPANRTLKVRDERGMTVILPVDQKAVASLETVKSGDLILLSWRNDRVTFISRK
jgi:hypothetical protein